mgnify:CR=1 FL=1
MNVPKKYNITVADFTDSGDLIKPDGDLASLKGISIRTSDGNDYVIDGFDYVSHLLGDIVVCSCGDQIDPHQIALHTKKRDMVLVPARCCMKFRWFRSEEND